MSNETPLIPILGPLIFPGQTKPLNVGKPQSVASVQLALKTNRLIAVAGLKTSPSPNVSLNDVYPIGVVCRINHYEETDGKFRLVIKARNRIELSAISKMNSGALSAASTPLYDTSDSNENLTHEIESLFSLLRDFVSKIGLPLDTVELIRSSIPWKARSEALCASLVPGTILQCLTYGNDELELSRDKQFQILSADNDRARLRIIGEILNDELEVPKNSTAKWKLVSDMLSQDFIEKLPAMEFFHADGSAIAEKDFTDDMGALSQQPRKFPQAFNASSWNFQHHEELLFGSVYGDSEAKFWKNRKHNNSIERTAKRGRSS